MDNNLQHAGITEKVIGAGFAVYGELGYGFLDYPWLNDELLKLHEQTTYS